MKAFQKQLQCQSQKLFELSSKRKTYEQLFRKAAKINTYMQKIPLNGLLNFQHRRKYQLPLFKQVVTYAMPRKSQQLQNINKIQDKESKIVQNKRHTHHVTDLNDLLKEKKSKIQEASTKEYIRDRVKYSMLSQQTMYPQQFNKSKSRWKVQEKTSKTKEKIQKHQNAEVYHYKTLKKIEKFNETDYSFRANAQQGSFINLIKKFKFQNLKTVTEIDNCLYSPVPSRIQARQGKKQFYFSQLRKTLENKDRQRQANQTKLVPQLQKNKIEGSKINRKISSLTPWQMGGEPQFFITAQMTQHI